MGQHAFLAICVALSLAAWPFLTPAVLPIVGDNGEPRPFFIYIFLLGMAAAHVTKPVPYGGVIGVSVLVATIASASFQQDSWPYYLWGVVPAVIMACMAGHKTILQWRPLQFFGTISYAVYLAHWPVTLWGLAMKFGPWQILLLNMSLSVPLAIAATFCIERPLTRFGHTLTRPRVSAVA